MMKNYLGEEDSRLLTEEQKKDLWCKINKIQSDLFDLGYDYDVNHLIGHNHLEYDYPPEIMKKTKEADDMYLLIYQDNELRIGPSVDYEKWAEEHYKEYGMEFETDW